MSHGNVTHKNPKLKLIKSHRATTATSILSAYAPLNTRANNHLKHRISIIGLPRTPKVHKKTSEIELAAAHSLILECVDCRIEKDGARETRARASLLMAYIEGLDFERFISREPAYFQERIASMRGDFRSRFVVVKNDLLWNLGCEPPDEDPDFCGKGAVVGWHFWIC